MAQTTLQTHLANRAAVEADVLASQQAIADRIDQAVEEGLYPDGLTTVLDNCRMMAKQAIRRLSPPVEETPVED